MKIETLYIGENNEEVIIVTDNEEKFVQFVAKLGVLYELSKQSPSFKKLPIEKRKELLKDIEQIYKIFNKIKFI